MPNKQNLQNQGFKIMGDTNSKKDEIFNFLKAKFPQIIKNDELDLNAFKDLCGINEKKGYELSFTGKGLANGLYNSPCDKMLKFDETFIQNDKTPQNQIIRGDNLDALKILKSAYSEKIKMIYIDPPYNTTNENFIYPDNFRQDYKKILEEVGLITIDENGDEIESEDLKFFKNIQGSRTHSGWLCFMLPRLKLARDLLKDDGVIFISIDDNEMANLKLLCDEIFGEDNFVAQVTWHRKRGKDNSAKFLSRVSEYILIYAKNIEFLNFNKTNLDDNTLKAYTNPDNDKRGAYRKLALWRRRGQGGSKAYSYKTNSGIMIPAREWLCSESTMRELDDENKLIVINGNLYRKLFLNEHSGNIPETIWLNQSNTANGKDEIKELFNNIEVFETPKPIDLLKYILNLSTTPNSNDIILDFFAGSGTTAQAVMELNAEDKGNRKFILVQLDEKIDEKKSKTAYDFCKKELKSENPVISDITIERVKRAALKYPNQNNSFNIYSVENKPKFINDEKDSLNLQISNSLTPFDKALNLALSAGKILTKSIKAVLENKLYECEDCYFVVDCDKEVFDFTKQNAKEKYIFIDGYADAVLEYFLNANLIAKDRIIVVY